MKWISVKDQLPEIDAWVLVYCDDMSNTYHVTKLYDENKYYRDKARTRKDKYPPSLVWSSDESYIEEVTHWMPLPQKPE